MSSPEFKRPRLSSSASSSTRRPPHPTSKDQHQPPDTEDRLNLLDKGKRNAKKDPLAGFDDREEEEEDAVQPSSNAVEEDASDPVGSLLPAEDPLEEEEDDTPLCVICLSPLHNRTVVSPCYHAYCWECISTWAQDSRKCPLCAGQIQSLLFNIRSVQDYQTYRLLPLSNPDDTLPSSSFVPPPPSSTSRRPTRTTTLPRHALYGRRQMEYLNDSTFLELVEERALEKRRFIYRQGLFAKHVASNRYTGFKPFTPQSFSVNPEMKARVIKFVRRELQVFPNVDISFLTTYLVSIASQLDLRSTAAVRLISDFIPSHDAEHLAHEIVTFARSPFTTLEGYDRVIQYGRPEGAKEMPKREEVRERMGLGKDEVVEDLPRFATREQDGRREGLKKKMRSWGGRPLMQEGERRNGWGYERERERDRGWEGNRRGGGGRMGGRDDEERFARSGGGRRGSGRDWERERDDERRWSGGGRGRGRVDLRDRSRERERSYSRSRSRDRDRDHSRRSYHSPSRQRSHSRSPPRRSRSPSHRPRSLTPLHSRSHSLDPELRPAISVLASPLSSHRPTPANASPTRRIDTPSAPTPLLSLSIFGAAAASAKNRPSPLVPSPSNTPAIDPSPLNQEIIVLSPPDSSTTTPPTTSLPDLRTKLQARLMAEYRTALANRAVPVSTVKPPVDLRALLKERLKKEKELSLGQFEERSRREEGTTTTFSEGTRELLLARLEEEKRRAADGGWVGEDEDNGWYGGGGGGEGGWGDEWVDEERQEMVEQREEQVVVPESEQQSAEDQLRKKLLAKRQSVVEAELVKRSGELKERLMREKLRKSRKSIVGGQKEVV